MERLLILATAAVGIAGGVLFFDDTGSVDASTPAGKFMRACEKNHKDASDYLMTAYRQERGADFGVRDWGVMLLHTVGVGGVIGSVCACARDSLGEEWSAADDSWVVAGRLAGMREKLNYSQRIKVEDERARAQSAMRSELGTVMAEHGLSLNQLDSIRRTMERAMDDCGKRVGNRG